MPSVCAGGGVRWGEGEGWSGGVELPQCYAYSQLSSSVLHRCTFSMFLRF